MKKPTKSVFRELLVREIDNWIMRIDNIDGLLKEQYIGRLEQCKWLLRVFDGEVKIGE